MTAMKILSLVDEDGEMCVYLILASPVCLRVDASVDSSIFLSIFFLSELCSLLASVCTFVWLLTFCCLCLFL